MTPIQHWAGYQSEPRFECGTLGPDQRQINRGYSEVQLKHQCYESINNGLSYFLRMVRGLQDVSFPARGF
jgi:hypothetical protein